MTNYNRPPDLYLPINTTTWKEETISSDNANELEIWAMSFYEEIALRSPDGLMNGKSIANAISKCIPAIKNPWNIPENDYRYIIIGLLLATYGSKTNITVKCDKCKEFNDYQLNLQQMLDTHNHSVIKSFSINELKFTLGDLTYKDVVVYRNNNYGLLRSMSEIQKNPDKSFNVELLQKELHQFRKNEIWLKSRRIKKIEIVGVGEIQTHNDIYNLIESFNNDISSQLNKHLNLESGSHNQILTCSHCNSNNSVDISLDPGDQFYRKLLNTSDENIESLFNDMDSQIRAIRKEVASLVWYMRGGVSYSECIHMSPDERKSLSEQIKENIETAKKTKVPII